MKKFFKKYIHLFSVLVTMTLIIALLPKSPVIASGSNSAYLQLNSDQYISTATTILTTSITLNSTQKVYVQSDGRVYMGGTEDSARMRLYVDGNPVGSDSVIDWRVSTHDCQHSYNCIAAVTLSSGNHTFSLLAIPLAGTFTVGSGSNLSVMTDITVNMQSASLSSDTSAYNFTTYGITPPSPAPHTSILSVNVNNSSGPIIALGSARGYYTYGGDMMLGIYKDGTALPTDQGVWTVNDCYSSCERQAPMYNHAYMNATGNHTISLDASEIPWPVDCGENTVQYCVGSSSSLIVLNGEMKVSGSAPCSTSVNDCWNWRNIGTGSGETVAIASAIVNIPSGHNGIVMFQAKTRFQGDLSDTGGNGFLWINIDGTDVGSLGIQQTVSGTGNSQRTACASYLSAGANALSVGNHTVTVYARAVGSFAHLNTSTDVPLIWFDGQSGTPSTGTNLISNPGFESGLTSWGASNSSIEISTANKYSGTNGCRVYNRTSTGSIVYQNITSLLNANGQGGYNLSCWGKLASGSDNAYIEVYISDSSGSHRHVVSSSTLNSSSFTKILGTMNITWTGTLTGASLYVVTQTSLSDIYLDDFQMSKY